MLVGFLGFVYILSSASSASTSPNKAALHWHDAVHDCSFVRQEQFSWQVLGSQSHTRSPRNSGTAHWCVIITGCSISEISLYSYPNLVGSKVSCTPTGACFLSNKCEWHNIVHAGKNCHLLVKSFLEGFSSLPLTHENIQRFTAFFSI